VVQTTFPNKIAFPAAAVIQPNGAIVVTGYTVVGSNTAGVLARYLPNGSLDASFGTGGIVTTPYANGLFWEALTLQRDGKIVVAGVSSDSSFNDYPTVARYRANGSLDSGFGTGGIEQAPLAAGRDAGAVIVQRDGKIVVGSITNGMGVLRFAPDGKSLDSSFDGDGIAAVPADQGGCGTSDQSGTNRIALTSGGAIIASGLCGGASMTYPEPAGGLLRFRGGTTANNGAFDTTFGSGGAMLSPFSRPNYAPGFARLADGRLLQLNQIGPGGNSIIGLFRTSRNGVLDHSFGTGGSATFKLAGLPSSDPVGLAVAPNGSLVVAAYDGRDDGRFALARRTASGSPDSRYGSGGQAVLKVGPPGPGVMSESGATTLVLQPDDRPVVIGTTYKNGHKAFTLVRFRAPTDVITRLMIKPSSIVAAPNGPPVKPAKARPPRGGVVTYIGSEPATTTTFTVQQPAPGRVQGRRCAKPSPKNRHHKRCTRYLSVGNFKHHDAVGLNRFRFTGRVHGRTLGRGRYRLRAIPRNSGGLGLPAYVAFRVKG
jgi:uncharacterized delta-60 repeat protein